MHRALIGFAAAASIGLATVAVPAPASAQCRGCAVGAGVAAGLIGGAIIGGAIANANNPPPPPPPPYGYPPPPPPPGYGPPPAAYGPPPAEYAQLGPGCYWSKPHKVWVDGYGWQWRRHPICP